MTQVQPETYLSLGDLYVGVQLRSHHRNPSLPWLATRQVMRHFPETNFLSASMLIGRILDETEVSSFDPEGMCQVVNEAIYTLGCPLVNNAQKTFDEMVQPAT